MNKMAMMHRLTQPARMATGGGMYRLPALEDDNVAPAVNATPPVAGMNLDFSGAPQSPAGRQPFNWKGLGQKIAGVGESLAPFASNIANAFQKPPMPALPTYDNSVTLTAPHYDAERSEVSREINGTNANLFRNLDANTAARLSLSNQGTKLDRLSGINERENNQRSEISNRQALINSGIQSRNNDKTDVYNTQLVERSIAQERTQSENIANAGDKYVGIQNEKRKAKVDLDKTRTMAEIFRNSGVGTRLRQQLMEDGVVDPQGQDYADLKKKRMGGVMSGKSGFNRALRPKATASYRQLLTAKPQ